MTWRRSLCAAAARAGRRCVASSGGAIYNANELVLSGADFLTVDDTVYNLGNIVLAGDVSFGGNVTFADSGSYAGTMKNNGNLDFYIVERGEDDGILISDWERISGGGSYSVTYDEKQAAGTYQLAANASDFDGCITVKSEDGTSHGELTLDMDKALQVGDISFMLELNEDTGVLSVVVDSEYSKRADREKQETRAQLPDTAFSKLSYKSGFSLPFSIFCSLSFCLSLTHTHLIFFYLTTKNKFGEQTLEHY